MKLLPWRVSRRALRLLALSYVVKSVLLALVFLFAPELPARTLQQARTALTRLASP